MTSTDHLPTVVDHGDKAAFIVWLGRALKTCHEEVIHEPIPAELLALLPPSKPN